MRADPETNFILNNLEKDSCLPGLESSFFTTLAAQGSPTNSGEARNMSKDVVESDLDEYACQGMEIDDTIFVQLLRISDAKGFVRSLPYAERQSLMLDLAITDRELATISFNKLERMVSAYTEIGSPYSGPVSARGGADMAWVADKTTFPDPLPSWIQMVRQLGLPHYERTNCGVVVSYPRSSVAPLALHLPRAFDGIDFPPFAVVDKCDGPCGMTKPLAGEPSRPEAVHRGCQIPLSEVTLLAWQ